MSRTSQRPKPIPLHAKARGPQLPAAEPEFGTYAALQAIDRTDPRVADARQMLREADTDSLVEQAVAMTQMHFAWDSVEAADQIFDRDDALSAAVSQKRWRVLLYAPLYVWNQCVNHCKYCGFNSTLDIQRESLDEDRAIEESDMLSRWGIRHQLLVAGEFPRFEKEGRLERIAQRMLDKGVIPSAEVAPRTVDGYRRLVDAGVGGLTLFQETYDRTRYNDYHPRGPKSVYDWRIEGLDRAATAGMRRLGLGALLGLADPAEELAAMVTHGLYLQDRYPDSRLGFNLPRLHATPGEFQPPFAIDDEQFLRFYCILRLTFPKSEMVLSTRERPEFRNRLAKICITQMSAASSTAPGGYVERSGEEQFSISDPRSVAEVVTWLHTEGFLPVSATC
jgi:2-iminoacetate synthase